MSRKISPWAWIPTLYFAEGLPYATVMIIAMVLYQQLGLSNADITLYTSWLYLPWVIKPIWSPFVDLLSTRRRWIVVSQVFIGASLAGIAFTINGPYWLQSTLFFFWVIAFSSATHDVAADGFYMTALDSHNQAWFVGIRSTFYRFSNIFAQGILVMLAGTIQYHTRNIGLSWSLIFYFMAGLFLLLWLYHSRALPRPISDRAGIKLSIRSLCSGFCHTFISFFKKPYVLTGLFFMLFYRMPEGLLVKVSTLFLLDSNSSGGLGLSPQEYGFVQGTVGVIGLLFGGILGGIVVARHGLKRWLWPMVCAITLPDAVYIYLSYAIPNDLFVISSCVFIEQFGYGFGFVAYMLYLIYFSRGAHKTSHYALCTAIMALSLMLPGLISGTLQQMVGYRSFFTIVILSCSITFLVATLVHVDASFGKKLHSDIDTSLS